MIDLTAIFSATALKMCIRDRFWRRSNWQVALAGMICGGSMVFIWKYGISTLGGAWGIYELLPAFLVAIAANIIVSLITKAPSKEITDEFDLVNQK